MPSPVPSPLHREVRGRAGSPAAGAPLPAGSPAASLRPTPFAVAAVALLTVGCASAGGPPPHDATNDPEVQRALREREPEFPRQRDALAAGVYEPFAPPESVALAGAAPAPPLEPAPPVRGRAVAPEDPSTEELLATLPSASPRSFPPRSAEAVPSPPRRGPAAEPLPPPVQPGPDPAGTWTVQLGAFTAPAAARRRAEEARAVAPEHEVRLAPRGGLTRVLLGRFPSRGAAEDALRALEHRGLGAAWVTTGEP